MRKYNFKVGIDKHKKKIVEKSRSLYSKLRTIHLPKLSLIQKRIALTVVGLLFSGILFYAGMVYQMYRDTLPEKRSEDIDMKSKVEALRDLKQREYITGEVKKNKYSSIIILDSTKHEVEIYTPENVVILGSDGKFVNLRGIIEGDKVTVTVTKDRDNKYEAVRIKLEK